MPPCGAPHDAVMEKRTLEANVTIEFDDDRIAGELRDARGAVSAFAGWLELISALESLAKPAGDGSPDRQETRCITRPAT